MWTDQDYAKSGFALNNITLGLNICTLNIKVTYENDIPLGQMIKITQNLDSQGNNIILDYNMCTQNIWITHENYIPWGQIKITQNLDSQKIR